jgi:hypothetical protein
LNFGADWVLQAAGVMPGLHGNTRVISSIGFSGAIPCAEKKIAKGHFHSLSRSEQEERVKRLHQERQERKIDAPIAMREYREAEQAARERTAKLRSDRLQREAAKKR